MPSIAPHLHSSVCFVNSDIQGMPMGSGIEIRAAAPADADAISRTIIRALRQTNAQDYPPQVIAAVAENFSPEHVRTQIATRQAYVALVDGVVIGTASLHGRVVRSVCRSSPSRQRRGREANGHR
jgi:hypothetical protein